MTRPADAARRTNRRARLRLHLGAIGGLAALVAGFVVVAAPAAHALVPCTNALNCPVAFDDGTGLPGGQFYSTPFDVKLTINANPADPAHDLGLMAHDEGSPGTRIELGGASDTTSFNGATITYTNNLNGSFTYTPDPNNPYSGIDQFDYSIIDPATGNDDFATAYVDVIASAHNDAYAVKTNTTLNVNTPGLTANDLGMDPDTITLDTTSAHGGAITDNFDGAFQYTPPSPTFTGTDTFGYTIMDIDWDYTYSATVTITVDGTPPVVSMSAPGTVSMSTRFTPAWSATDASGIRNYDVQYEIAPWNGAFSAWTAWKTGTTSTSSAFAGASGRTFCFRARATDNAGNVSAFVTRCTSTPLQSVSLKYTRLWTKRVSTSYFAGVGFTTTTKGQNALLAGVQAQHMWLLATKCSTCGSVQVRFNGAVIANASLASPVTTRHALIPIAAFPTPRAGTVQVYVTSPTGKLVAIEGLAVLRA
jgi:hypothetical protein